MARKYNSKEVLELVVRTEGSESEQSSLDSDEDDDSNVDLVVHNAPQVKPPQQFDWDDYDFLDPHYPDWLPDYQRQWRVLVDTSDCMPVDYFRLFFPDEAFDLIVTETNRCGEQFFDNRSELHPIPVFVNGTIPTPLK